MPLWKKLMPDSTVRTGARQFTLAGKSSYNPVIQGVALLLITLAAVILGHLFHIDEKSEWYMAATFLLLFTAGNPIMGIFRKRWYRYVGISFLVYIALTIAVLAATQAIARVSLQELGDFKFFFTIEAIFYILVTGLVGLYRFIIQILNETA